jgi:manganese-dependent inorganic pyrophosphatase
VGGCVGGKGRDGLAKIGSCPSSVAVQKKNRYWFPSILNLTNPISDLPFMILRDTATKVTYVIGHRNPDTDAICSAIAYADFLKQTTRPEAVAACCGQINARTQWLLKFAKVEPPLLLMDVRPTASSICRRNVETVKADDTFLDVYERMVKRGVRSVPVVDERRRMVGMPTMHDLVKLLLPSGVVQIDVRTVAGSLENITKVLKGEMENPVLAWQEEELQLLVCASSPERMLRRMQKLDTSRLLIVVGDRPQVQRQALEYKVRALVLTGKATLSDDLRGLAAQNNVTVITSSWDTAMTAQLIQTAGRVSGVAKGDFLKFRPSDLVGRILQEVHESNQPLFPVIQEGSEELVGVFSKSDLVDPPKARLVLVDHNEFSQAVQGAEDAEIVEVIDHHRLSGDLTSKEPIRFINETLGSTCSLVATMFRIQRLKPSQGIARCMCAGIIADTLLLTSPTTTTQDKAILDWLSSIAKIDPKEFAKEFFAAGSALTSLSPEEVVSSDRKEYTENGWKISISQVEELGLHHFWPKREKLQESLDKLVEDGVLDFACLMVTDITEHHSLLMTAGEHRIKKAIEFPRTEGGLIELPGVVSRKKQLFPMLGQVLSKISREVMA